MRNGHGESSDDGRRMSTASVDSWTGQANGLRRPSIIGGSAAGAAKRLSMSLGPLMGGTNSFRDDSDEEEKSGVKQTFVDAEMMKEKVRKSLMKPEVKKEDYYKKRGCAQAVAKNKYFDSITLCVIAFNALWIAHDTDANDSAILLEADMKFQIAEHMFCLYFFSEWFIRFTAFAKKRDCAKDGWFIFDSALVLMMVLETWIMTLIMLIIGSTSTGLGNALVMRIARMLRLTRMARMARLLRVMPELMILIKGMLAAVRSVCFTMLLLTVILYVFAIALTQLCAGTPVQSNYFKSVPSAMYELMMRGCLLDGPKELSDALAKESALLPPLFWVFVLVAALTVMNMLVGVLCEVVSAVAASEKEEHLVTFVKGRVQKIVEKIDESGDGKISAHEFKQIVENPTCCRALADVGVDVVGLVDLADTIFKDEQGNTRSELDFEGFMHLVLQLRGSNVATVKDVVHLRKMLLNVSQKLTNLQGLMDKPSSPSNKRSQMRNSAQQVVNCNRVASLAEKGCSAEAAGSLHKVPEVPSLKLAESLWQEQLVAATSSLPVRLSGLCGNEEPPLVKDGPLDLEQRALTLDILAHVPGDKQSLSPPGGPPIPGVLSEAVSTTGSVDQSPVPSRSSSPAAPSCAPPTTRLARLSINSDGEHQARAASSFIMAGPPETAASAIGTGAVSRALESSVAFGSDACVATPPHEAACIYPPADCLGFQQQVLQLSTLLTVRLQQLGASWEQQGLTRTGAHEFSERCPKRQQLQALTPAREPWSEDPLPAQTEQSGISPPASSPPALGVQAENDLLI